MKPIVIGSVLDKLFKSGAEAENGKARSTCNGCKQTVADHAKDKIVHIIKCAESEKGLRVEVANHALNKCNSLSEVVKVAARALVEAENAETRQPPSVHTGASASGRPNLAQPGLAAFGVRAYSKEQIAKWEAAVARFVHENGLPMTITSTSQWKDMIGVLVGSGLAQRELNVTRRSLSCKLLDNLEAEIDEKVYTHFERNVMPGCATLITDSVTDEKGGSVCNSGVYVRARIGAHVWRVF